MSSHGDDASPPEVRIDVEANDNSLVNALGQGVQVNIEHLNLYGDAKRKKSTKKLTADYFQGVLSNPRILRWKGDRTATHSDLFIPGRAVAVDLITRRHLRGHELDLPSLLDRITSGERDKVLLLGDPGVGKTAALEYYTLTQATLFSAGRSNFPVIPVPLNLYSGNLEQAIRAAINALSDRNFSVEEACSLAQGSGGLICFDGLNELGDFRHQGVREISAWMDSNPQLSFVITCRWDEYDDDFEENVAWRILPFRQKEIEEYLAWHSKAQKVPAYSNITAEPGLRDLSSNPLILHMLSDATPTGPLPKHRGPLYEVCVNMMLRRQGAKSRSTVRIPFEVRQRVLAYLAYQMQCKNTVRYSSRQISDCLAEFLDLWRESFNWRNLLSYCTASGLLIHEGESYIFLHQTIQEYFAACAIEDRGIEAIDNEGSVLTNARWNEVFLLLAGITRNPSELLRKLVKIDPVMAVKCISHGASANAEVLDLLLQELASMATSPNWIERRNSADLAGELGRASAHPILLDLLSDENDEVRWGAVYALRKIGLQGAVVPALIGRLDDHFWVTQGEAATALSHLNATEAIPKVVDNLSSGNPYVRACATDALVKFYELSQEGREVIESMVEDPSVGGKELIVFAISVATAGAQRTARLEATFNSKSVAVIEAAIRMIVANPSATSADKIKVFASHDNPSLRSTAVTALGKIQAREYAALVGQTLVTDEEEIVRESAATALGEIQAEEAGELLLRSVEDNSPKVRFAVARSLGRLRVEAARPHLRKWAAVDPDVRVRIHAIRALGFLGAAEDREFLERRRNQESDRDALDSLAEAIENIKRGHRRIRF